MERSALTFRQDAYLKKKPLPLIKLGGYDVIEGGEINEKEREKKREKKRMKRRGRRKRKRRRRRRRRRK